MPTLIPVGPYQTREAVEGVPFPYYIIPFDEDGVCVGPLTLAHLLENCSGYSDIFVFSHGWNNDWSTATKRYEDFIEGLLEDLGGPRFGAEDLRPAGQRARTHTGSRRRRALAQSEVV